ncbi:glycosyltransferase domain-containing protein [Parapedobacter sp. DT-150]|uniref:glycosyltransferase domain-containing protein n=1 Tax=Parapedobacter sp. DT-150 TaxID=3396162 RepID=UPI003F1A499E
MKNVIYTAIFGDYEGLLPQKQLAGWDFICFTDNKQLQAAPWQVVLVEPPVAGDNVRSSRYVKINPHLFLAEYEISIFIDGNFLVIGNVDQLVETVLSDGVIACFDHNQNTRDARDCVYVEYAAIKQLAEERGVYKDDPEVMERQMAFLRAEGYPEHNGLVYSGVLLRKHHDPQLISAMEDWWYMVKHYSRRDQLSFDYAMWKNQLTYQVIPGDSRRGNGYFYMLGAHRKDWSSKLLKFRLKSLLGLVKRNG